ncbi:MAG: benzoate/H(+) symporter BenE family transporter [Deltaproteobacteria bacterium]|nr:benzoate/H(+) symporter BenE family transporter [Deltaproteobacteria bacterium]
MKSAQHPSFTFERPVRPPPNPLELVTGCNRHNVANGIVGFIYATTGPLAIMLAVSTKGGLTTNDISSWIFGGYGLGGIMSILFSLLYRQPIGMAWTIPGAILLGPALTHLSFPEVIGAYLATGILIFVLGMTGWIRKGMTAIPMPIVMGMVSGVFLPFCLKIVLAFQDAMWISLGMVLTFVVIFSIPRFARVLPPVLGALIVGMLIIIGTGKLGLDRPIPFTLVRPNLYMPAFSIRALLELVIPLAVTVIGIHNAQGFAVLKTAGYTPPINTLTVACGIGTLFFGIFGAVPACVTGPVNAILNSSGRLEQRYIGGIVFGICIFLFGLFAPVATQVGLALPSAFIGMLGGLAMIRVLENAMKAAFRARFSLGALVTFIVTFSDITIFNVGAAFWGLVFGVATSLLAEREDLKQMTSDK